jgi:hypothetical protein
MIENTISDRNVATEPKRIWNRLAATSSDQIFMPVYAYLSYLAEIMLTLPLEGLADYLPSVIIMNLGHVYNEAWILV